MAAPLCSDAAVEDVAEQTWALSIVKGRSLGSLPDLCLLTLFDLLPLETRIRLRSVCRRWDGLIRSSCRESRALATDNYDLLQWLWGVGAGGHLRALRLSCLDHRFPHLEELLDSVSFQTLATGRLSLLALSRFRWACDSELGEKWGAEPLPALPSLRSLSLTYPRGGGGYPISPLCLSRILIVQRRFPRLTRLRLHLDQGPDYSHLLQQIMAQDGLPLDELHLHSAPVFPPQGLYLLTDGWVKSFRCRRLSALLLASLSAWAEELEQLCQSASSLRVFWLSGSIHCQPQPGA